MLVTLRGKEGQGQVALVTGGLHCPPPWVAVSLGLGTCPQLRGMGFGALVAPGDRDSPSVKRGSGSFRKKDFKRLLMTFRSCHRCGGQKRLLRGTARDSTAG